MIMIFELIHTTEQNSYFSSVGKVEDLVWRRVGRPWGYNEYSVADNLPQMMHVVTK